MPATTSLSTCFPRSVKNAFRSPTVAMRLGRYVSQYLSAMIPYRFTVARLLRRVGLAASVPPIGAVRVVATLRGDLLGVGQEVLRLVPAALRV